MKYKKLIIVDLKEDASINYDNALYVYLNNGKINFENSQRIYLEFIRKKNILKVKNNLIRALRDKVNKSRKILECFPELEFFNLRNDKDPIYDLLLNILLINKYKKLNKIKETIVVTDNEITKDYFSKNDSSLEVCSHRTNSIARFIRFNAILNCMEIDVFVENDYLDVTHSKEETQ